MVLAGGKSSRMGKDKSLLTLPDSQDSLLEHCVQKLTLLCANNVFISGAQHEQGIADIIPNCGPLSGIHAVITHIEKYHQHISEVLVVAVDMPALCSDDLVHLHKTGKKSQSICFFEDHFLPLYIPLSTNVTQYLKTVLKQQSSQTALQSKSPQYSLKMMLDSLHALPIQPLKNTYLDNINTPQQWQQHCLSNP